ncbi:hypothetical protein GUJ93_ZPchr0006g42232 [Zizania palustris]|uniref:Uncharacterized protein n=1 Tax=Zizania palustris TaxID=103762 RepID=A0A8J5SQ31_ZIZPA|nr:hypothetical protein GUJ93_ZPchr0006g42232 [Zizania palustris]
MNEGLARGHYSTRSLHLCLFVFCSVIPGRQRRFMVDQGSVRQQEELGAASQENKEAPAQVHARMLNVKTNDYGSYDPAPSMDKPHFKLIPN